MTSSVNPYSRWFQKKSVSGKFSTLFSVLAVITVVGAAVSWGGMNWINHLDGRLSNLSRNSTRAAVTDHQLIAAAGEAIAIFGTAKSMTCTTPRRP